MSGKRYPPVSRTPLKQRLLAEIAEPANPYRALVDVSNRDAVTWRVDGEKVHGSVTQALNLMRQAGLIVEAASKPMRWHEPRAVSPTERGRAVLDQWTREAR